MVDKKYSILIVEDEVNILNLIETFMHKAGIEIHKAASSEEAIKIINSGQKFDCIVSDYSLPGMNGILLGSEILKIDPKLPIILQTGSATNEIIDRAKKIGFYNVIEKPYDFNKLVDMVITSIEEKKL